MSESCRSLETMVGRIPRHMGCHALFTTALQNMKTIYSKIYTVKISDAKYEYNDQDYSKASTALSSAITKFKTEETQLRKQNVDYDDILEQALKCQKKIERLQEVWKSIQTHQQKHSTKRMVGYHAFSNSNLHINGLLDELSVLCSPST